MKRKILVGMMSALLAVGMAVPVGATETNPKSDSTTVTADVASSFVLSIPSTTDIVYKVEKTQIEGTLKVTGNVDTDEQVTVSVQPGQLHNESHNENIVYTITEGTGAEAFTGAAWSETELRAGSKEFSLHVNISDDAWEQAKAGDYEGIVTFTAQLGKVSDGSQEG